MIRSILILFILIILVPGIAISCSGSKKDKPIYDPETEQDRELSGEGGAYNIGGSAPPPEAASEKEYTSPFATKKNTSISWVSSIASAKNQATQGSGLKILVWFTNSKCAECRTIEAGTFASEEVLAEAAKYVWVRFDTDGNTEMAKYYLHDAEPPVLMWLDQGGNEYHKLLGGFDDPKRLGSLLRDWH